MKNIRSFIATATIASAILAQAQSVEAQYGQYGDNGQYGQGGQYGKTSQPGQQILIDKLVAEPGTTSGKGGVSAGIFRDNLPVNGKRFQPGEEVVFRLVVKNITNETLKNITVTDKVPTFVEPMVGPGTFSSKDRTITYVIKELKPGQEDIQYVRMQIYPQNKLPADQGIVQQLNQVEVVVNDQRDQDTAQYFIEKQTINVTQVPKTGPALGLAFLALQGIGLAIGLKLRQHAK